MSFKRIIGWIIILLCLYSLFCIFSQRGLSIDCKSFGYAREVSGLNACVDQEGKLHLFESQDDFWRSFIIPFTQTNWTEIK